MIALSSFPADAAGWLAFLLHVTAKATLVLVTAAVACLALRRASAALRHLIWTMAIVCLLGLPLLSVVLPSWQVGGLPHYVPASINSLPMPDSAVRPMTGKAMVTTSAGGLIEPEAEQPSLASEARSPERSATPSVPAASASLSERIPSLVLLLWALGASVACAHVLISMLCVHRALRRARRLTDPVWQRLVDDASAQLRLRRPVALLCSQSEAVPMVWGWRRAILLLPAEAEGWSPQRRWLVILHELAHVKRADCVTQMLGYLARGLYWFNPLAWLATHRLRREREQACDDLVLNSGLRSSDYAAHLLEIAGRLQRPTLAHMAAVAMARPAGLEARIRAILDASRTRRAVPRLWALVVAVAATGLLAAVASVQGADVQPADQPTHHALGAREQWQPQTESDPRLQRRVRFEVLGRAAVPALAMLSEQTGVSLAVAPEDLETVGERKLTIIAQGCSLKALMVQIPSALQECHWDIDPSGPEPVYLLHRNGDVEAAMVQLIDEEPAILAEETRPAREARIADARAALAMSPDEVQELAKTDPLLAAAVKDPGARKWMESFVSLPDDKMQEFSRTGWLAMDMPAASPALQQAVRDYAASRYQEAKQKDEHPEFWQAFVESIDQANLTYQDTDRYAINNPIGWGIILEMDVTAKSGMGFGDSTPVVPPRGPGGHGGPFLRDQLLVRTGMDEKAADVLLADLAKQAEQERLEARDRRRQLKWREPQSPELHKEVALPFTDPVDAMQVQQFLAEETGLSLVSDYFTTWGPREIPEEARARMPVWRLLYMLGEYWFWTYDWNEAGDCLVFHDRRWCSSALQECPESLVTTYRAKLAEQGLLTLDDAVAFATELDRRRPRDPELRKKSPMVPSDLEGAGLFGYVVGSEVLLLYATLTPEQKVQARGDAGLAYGEMTSAQQARVANIGQEDNNGRPLPDGELSRAVFRAKVSHEAGREPTTTVVSGMVVRAEAGGPAQDIHSLAVEFPGRRVAVRLRLRTAPARP